MSTSVTSTDAGPPASTSELPVSLAYDMRAPSFGTPAPALYRAAIEQCAVADRAGFQSVVLSEHHGSDDGYLPSPIVLGAAIAGATRHLLIRLNVVLLPLYDPVRLASDLAVLDLASSGRLRLTVAAGYRPEEYEQFGRDIRRRPSLMERGIDVLKQAWTGEPFELDGRSVRVTPRPAQQPRPSITLGGASPATARRAARIADDYSPVADRLYEIYLEELAALGRPAPAAIRPPVKDRPVFVHVSEDPDRDWPTIAPHALHESSSYAEWAGGSKGAVYTVADDAEALRASGKYLVVTPDEAVELARRHGSLTLKPLIGGLDPDVGWSCLQLVADRVIPALRPRQDGESR